MYGWNIFSIEVFNCVFVGKKFLGEFFGRFVGFERIGFIQHIFSSVREEGTKIFLEEKNKKTSEKNKKIIEFNK